MNREDNSGTGGAGSGPSGGSGTGPTGGSGTGPGRRNRKRPTSTGPGRQTGRTLAVAFLVAAALTLLLTVAACDNSGQSCAEKPISGASPSYEFSCEVNR